MTIPASKTGTPFLPLSLLLIVLFVFAGTARLFAQQQPASGSGTASPPANPTPGLLTPPPDTSASSSSTTPAATSPSDTSSPAPSAPPAATSTSTPMTRQEIARIQQQEIIRRQELVFQANESLSAGRKAELAQDYPEARKDYLFCVEAYGSISRATVAYSRAAEGLTRVDFQLYDAALARGNTLQAKQLIDEVVKYNPNNQLANQKLLAINRALANPNDTSILGNPAITPGFVSQVNQVQELFALAEQYRRTGQWDMEESSLRKILGIDPYNIAATKALEQLQTEKYDYAEHARLQNRDQRLREVEEKWFEPINNNETGVGSQEGQPVLERATTFNLDQELKSIFLSLDFTNATIEEATNFLTVKSKDLDPDHKGVNFIIDPDASTSAKPITLTLNNVPMGEALRYICQLAGVKFKVQDYAISIVSFSKNTDELISRTFIVPPNFVAPPQEQPDTSSAFNVGGGARPLPTATPTTAPAGSEDPVLTALKAKGLKFPPGASAVYTTTTGQLTVVDTADQMELLEELVNAGQAPTLMVRVATKFVEINQTDLNDLTVNTALNYNPISTTAAGTTVGGPTGPIYFASALPGALNIPADSIDALINPVSTTFNQLAVRGFLGPVGFNMVFNALAQKQSLDLLTEPAVLIKSGETGTLTDIRIFPYPTAFDPPQLVQPTTTTTITSGPTTYAPPTVIPTIPTEFKRRNIGETLTVKPQIVADNKTIDLSLVPEVTDFEGFINYGSPLFVANPVDVGLPAFTELSPNILQQPVFNVRHIQTKVLIQDGSTVVLGGLIRDDVETVNDRVPFLGDLPFIGRLFQSKAVQDSKKDLLIFVTASIYQNDGELLNPPAEANAADVLTGHGTVAPIAAP